MRLITLNTWARRLKEPFDAFLKGHMGDTDIFCFQEVFNNYDGSTGEYIKEEGANGNILQEITDTLSEFDQYFCPVAENVFGLAIFLKKGIEIIASGEVMLYQSNAADDSGDHDRKMQWVHIKHGRKDVMIMNVHGHWNGHADDTPNRLEQSRIINEFMDQSGMTPKILVGDFNLNPSTESIKLLEKTVINLNAKHDVKSTRTEHYTGDATHTDYIFVSSEILVEKFEVMPDVVSDHSPLSLQFDVF
ncbi:MAG TPA: endonuclease/exonuclease/phosphatase family protein [Candidatus Paceibacterota bacterium]|nr:endonuclease/exonuclease/phosphatase family protein [Candidatus Paceibacterota bacterium]